MDRANKSYEDAYLQNKMENLSMNSPKYGKIGNVAKAEPAGPYQTVGSKDYTLYQRQNVIASSKYATPKQLDTLGSHRPTPEENNVYVQVAKPQVPPSASPTHSSGPVYENIDYYPGHRAQQSYSYNEKAQPQVPLGNRDYASGGPSVYENVQSYYHKSSGAQPGPQVPSTYQYHQIAAPDPQHAVYSVMHAPRSQSTTSKAGPQSPTYGAAKKFDQMEEINGSDYVCMTGNVSQTLSTNTQFQTSTAKNYDRYVFMTIRWFAD